MSNDISCAYVSKIFLGEKCLKGMPGGVLPGVHVLITIQDYKSSRVAVTIWSTLVNTQADKQRQLIYYKLTQLN